MRDEMEVLVSVLDVGTVLAVRMFLRLVVSWRVLGGDQVMYVEVL